MGLCFHGYFLGCVPHACPCGYRSDPKRACKCTPNQVDQYMSKISGPLLDRIDIHMDVSAVSHDDLLGKAMDNLLSIL